MKVLLLLEYDLNKNLSPCPRGSEIVKRLAIRQL
jgi:hypothetical protein